VKSFDFVNLSGFGFLKNVERSGGLSWNNPQRSYLLEVDSLIKP
jgi:hypothetical protein